MLSGEDMLTPAMGASRIGAHRQRKPGFPDLSLWLRMAREEVPETVQEGSATLEGCLRYSNHRSIMEDVIPDKIKEDLGRGWILVFPRSSPRRIRGLRVSLLGAVVSPQNVRVIHDLTFDLSEENRRGRVNAHTSTDDSPPCLRAYATPILIRELIKLRRRYPERRIRLSKTDFHYAFRKVRINPGCAQSFGYTFGDFILVVFRLTYGWALSPAYCGVPAEAVVLSHRHTSFETM